MSQSIEQCLFQAIKNDDVKAFGALTEKARCGEYRLGRFPVLSLMYLYKSRRLVSAYGEEFLKITDFKELREPAVVSKKFAAKAGKCLRLYLNEAVSPLEMLLILDKTRRLKRVYPLTKPSEAVKERLKSIYFIKYSLNVKFEGGGIIIDRRPLSYREKRNIATVCLCSTLAVTLAVGVPITTVALIPKPVEGEVTKLSQIDFGSTKEYTLKRDIVLPESYSVEKVNCVIYGGENKLIFGNGATLGELNGKISDLTIESSGSAVFTSVSEKGAIENVTVNVVADVAAAEDTAFVALTNYGTIDGVTVNVSGKISALAASAEVTSELTVGGIVQNNYYKYNAATQTIYRGVIKNCTVNYSRFTLSGVAGANAMFGGVAGVNNGYLQDCTVSGGITADTFDIAGICSVNNGVLSGNVNSADLSQTSSDTGWNPIVSGIVLNNTYAVENCENRGRISAVSACGQFEVQEGMEPTVSAAGIAHISRGASSSPYIKNCTNSGGVECGALYRNAYAAGVCVSSNGGIESCKNSGAVTVRAENGNGTYAGGITALTYGNIINSLNSGAVGADGSGTAYAGGISALSCALVSNCLSSGNITVTAGEVCAGGILGISEVASYGFYVYCGNADYCISESKITVTVTENTPAYVGGIAGYVREARFNSGGSAVYFGGSVTNCFFTGSFGAEVSYSGNITGVCGANIYESNSYTSGAAEYHNFEGNYYLNGSLTAFGAALSDDGSFVTAEDKGAISAPLGEIQNSEAYKNILSVLNKE